MPVGEETVKLSKSEALQFERLAEDMNKMLGRLPRRLSNLGKVVDRLDRSKEIHGISETKVELLEGRELIELAYATVDQLEKLQPGSATDARKELDRHNYALEEVWLSFHDAASQARRVAQEVAEAGAPRAAPAAGAPVNGDGMSMAEMAASLMQRNATELKPDPLRSDADFDDFCVWRRKLEDYFDAAGYDQLKPRTQRAYLKNCLSDDLNGTLEKYLEVPNTASVAETLKRLEEYFARLTSIVKRRNEWYEFKQKTGETMTQLFVRLMRVASHAELDKMTYEDHLVAKAIIAVNDEGLTRKLLELDAPSFETVKKKCENWESAHTTAKQLRKTPTVSAAHTSTYKKEKQGKRLKMAAEKGSSGPPKSEARTAGGSGGTPAKASDRCFKCGKEWNKDHRTTCPALKHTCTKCKKRGHFEAVCRSSKSTHVNMVDLSTVFVADARPEEVCEVVPSVVPCEAAPVRLKARNKEGKQVKMNVEVQPDTGSSISLMPAATAKAAGVKFERSERITVRVANTETMVCDKTFDAIIEANGQRCRTAVFVSDTASASLLSRAVVQALKMVPANFPHAVVNAVDVGGVRSGQRPAANGANSPENDQKSARKDAGRADDGNKSSEIKSRLLSEFADVFTAPISTEGGGTMPKPMKGPPMEIRLKEEAKPVACHIPRKIPYALEGLVKKELDEMVKKGLLVPVDDPTDWCSPFLAGVKPTGDIRLMVDYSPVNRYVKRPVHPFPAARAAVTSIPPKNKWFASVDAVKGYWQLLLSEEASLITTFLTPWGRFRYTRAPMGLASSGDEFCLRGDRALAGLENFVKVIDDVLVYAATMEELEEKVRKIFARCRKHGITLAPKKFKFGMPSINFVGYTVSGDGVVPAADKLEAISGFPKPKDRTDLRSFMGLAQQLGGFHMRLTEVLQPLRPLLSDKRAFVWEAEHQQAFEEARRVLSSVPVMAHFDPDKPITLVTDASRIKGLGFALLQEEDGHNRVVTCGSRSLTPAESNYAVVELELLAVAWACRQCRVYLIGLPQFKVITDHRPLKGINAKPLDAIENPRLLRLLEKLRTFQFETEWVAGKTHMIADALSRAPVSRPDGQEDDVNDGVLPAVALIEKAMTGGDLALITPGSGQKRHPHYKPRLTHKDLQLFQTAAAQDAEYKRLKHDLQTGGSGKEIQTYGRVYKRLSLDEPTGLVVLDGHRVVVPVGARQTVLRALHQGHQGSTRTYAHARGVLYWPKMRDEIERVTETCDSCQKHFPSTRREPRQSDPIEKRPMQSVSTDLFEHSGRHYLVVTDRFTSYPYVARFKKAPSSRQVLDVLLDFFSLFGLPEKIRSDGGPQYSSAEFKSFCSRLRIDHETSSAHYPESNGHAEVAVRTVKALTKRADTWEDFQLGLLEIRATPLADGLSPAQWMMKRGPRTTLPGSPEPPASRQERLQAFRSRLEGREKETAHANRSSLEIKKPVAAGDTVRIQDRATKTWDAEGVVVRMQHGGRSALVRTGGRLLSRNRRFLRRLYRSPETADPAPVEPAPKKTPKAAPRPPTVPAAEPGPRRSSRAKKKPPRLGV